MAHVIQPLLYDPEDPGYRSDPYPLYARLRTTEPVHRSPLGYWVLSRYADIDLVAHRRASRALRDVLEAEGYQPERTFNAAHGAHRLLYHAADRRFHVDVFLDEFRM